MDLGKTIAKYISVSVEPTHARIPFSKIVELEVLKIENNIVRQGLNKSVLGKNQVKRYKERISSGRCETRDKASEFSVQDAYGLRADA